MINKFFNSNPFEIEVKHGEYFFRIDSVEETQEGEKIYFLDAVLSQTFYEFLENNNEYSYLELHHSIFEFRNNNQYTIFDELNDQYYLNDWFYCELSTNNSEIDVFVYSNMSGEPSRAYLEAIEPIFNIYVSLKLRRIFSLDQIPSASKDQIKEALPNREISWVSAFDVGQGNCNGLMGVDNRVEAYFDFGGGVLGNTRTYPNNLNRFCKHKKSVVILSHWDWDHWSSIKQDRYPDALSWTWIVPRQESQLGAIHFSFVQSILASGNLLIWPDNIQSISKGQIIIEKCLGKGRNHDGLALLVDGPDEEDKPILLTGDARYNVIPSVSNDPSKEYQAIVVPHHGGNMRNKFAPSNYNDNSKRLIYSYGENNIYGHPHQISIQSHTKSGWEHNNSTSDPTFIRNQGCDAGPNNITAMSTSLRNPDTGLGHLGFGWNEGLPCSDSWRCCKSECQCDLKIENT